MPSKHRRKGAAGKGSTAESLEKKARTVSSGRVPHMLRGKDKACTDSRGENKVELGAPSRVRHDTPGIKEAGTSTEDRSAGEQQLMATTSGPLSMLSTNSVSGTDGNAHPSPSLVAHGAEAHTGPSMDALDGSTKAKDCEESAAKLSTGEQQLRATTSGPLSMLSTNSVNVTDGNAHPSPSLVAHRAEAHTGPSMDALDGSTQAKDCEESASKLSAKNRADTALNEGMLQKHGANEAYEEPSSSDIVRIPAMVDSTRAEEAKLAIDKCNQMGLGENISYEEYDVFLQQLPSEPCIDTSSRLNYKQLKELDFVHALYRFRYYKYKLSQPRSKEELRDDKLAEEDKDEFLTEHEEEEDEGFTDGDEEEEEEEDDYDIPLKEDIHDFSENDCSKAFLKEHGFFKYLEEDGTFDWCFDPDFFKLAALNDYQRLVPRNYGGCEYVSWDEYRKYFYSYESELEYLEYYEELSKHLKWMEYFLPIEKPSLKWGCICTRGAYQAVKIATNFSKITEELAFTGYYECVESMGYDVSWSKELDGVYFEIWQRISNQTMSFEDAMKDIYHRNMFPLRQQRIEWALEFIDTMEEMKGEFLTCKAYITGNTGNVTEDKVRELMAEAVKKLVKKPKFYENYIRRKVDIARAIGLPECDSQRLKR